MDINPNNPIGIFDSGIGGLTVAYAVSKLLPNENIVYFGDTAHLPYGEKSDEAIFHFSVEICKFLLEQKCKLIVIACNSAASVVNDELKQIFKDRIQFVNVVDPLVNAFIESKSDKVGVIATKTTIRSNVYKSKINQINPMISVMQLATPLLVPMIEEAFVNNNISHSIIENYLKDPLLKGINHLLLACTHYPLIKEEIIEYYNNKVTVLDSTDIVAHEVKRILVSEKLLNTGKNSHHHFYVSDYTKSFEDVTKLFYGEQIRLKEKNIW